MCLSRPALHGHPCQLDITMHVCLRPSALPLRFCDCLSLVFVWDRVWWRLRRWLWRLRW